MPQGFGEPCCLFAGAAAGDGMKLPTFVLAEQIGLRGRALSCSHTNAAMLKRVVFIPFIRSAKMLMQLAHS
jgi:hypothetical protein